MTRPAICLALFVLAACGSGLDPARDITGTWEGTGPNGAFFSDNVANPNCAYEADVRIVFVQDGQDLTGSFTLTVRKSTKLLMTNVPCLSVGTVNSEALFGTVTGSGVAFETFNTRVQFTGSFTTDILTASFVSTQPGGIQGDMTVRRK